MLPEDSKTKSAISNDEDYAREFVWSISDEEIREIMERPDEEIEPPTEGYTNLNAQLDGIRDAVDSLRITVVSLLGSKKGNSEEKPVKRPTTAIQRELRKRMWELDKEESEELFSQFGFQAT